MIVQNMAAICPYRVGDYLQTENPTHPSTSWPGTSWERLQGRMLMGASDTYPVGSEGGEAQHTLTVAEMPAHAHQIAYQDDSSQQSISRNSLTSRYTSGWRAVSGPILDAGSGQPHNNLPPYRSVYLWRRTA